MPKLAEKERIHIEEAAVQSTANSFAERLRSNPAEAMVEEEAIGVVERGAHRKGLTREDAIWSVVGSARSTGAKDVSEQKHKYLAQGHTAKKK